MPDWRELVKQKLLSADEEVVAELAAHLEETYDQARSRGCNEAAALELTLRQAGLEGGKDWRVLAREIRRSRLKEGPLNHRTKSLWLPALLTLLGASVSLMATQFLGVQPRLVWVHGMGITLYWTWLVSLPAFGAFGAYLSRRAHASLSARIAAGLSPALIMLTVMLIILPWGLLLDGLHFFTLVSFGLGLANWVALPAFALLLGALPFLREPQPSGPQRSGS